MADMGLKDYVALGTRQESPIAPVSEGIQTGMKLAQTQQQLEGERQQLEAQKEELDTHRFNKAVSTMQTIARSHPSIGKKMIPTVMRQFQQAGIPMDQGILETLASDEEYKKRFSSISNALSEKAADPATRMQAMSAFQDIGEFDKGLSLFESQNKQYTAAAIAQAKTEGMLSAAGVRANATVEAAKIRGGPAAARLGLQANNQYQQTMKATENGLITAGRAEHIMEKVEHGDLKANKSLRGDLVGTLATLVNNGRPSTVYGQSHVEFDSAYQNLKDKLNYLQGKAENTIPPDQLAQLKADIVALAGMYGEQHQHIYSSFREGIDPSLRGNLDSRFNKMRKGAGLSEVDFGSPTAAPTTPSAAPTPAPTPAPTGAHGINVKAVVDTVKADPTKLKGVVEKLLSRGVSQAEIDKALGGK